MKSLLTFRSSVAMAIALALFTSLLPGFAAQGRTAYLLLINESSSMDLLLHDPGARRYRIARLFVERLQEGDLLQVLEFASETQPLLLDWTAVNEENRPRLKALLTPRRLDRRGPPEILNALGQALAAFDALPLPVEKQVTILLSNGEPALRRGEDLYQLLQEFARRQIPVHTFALTSYRAQSLTEISERTLAHAYRASGDFKLVALGVSRIIEEATVLGPPGGKEPALQEAAKRLLNRLSWQVQAPDRLTDDQEVRVSARLVLAGQALNPPAATPDGWQVVLDEAQVSLNGQVTEMRYDPTDRSYHANLGRRALGAYRLRLEAHGRLLFGEYVTPFTLVAERQLTISAPPPPPPPQPAPLPVSTGLPTLADPQTPVQVEGAAFSPPLFPLRVLLGGLLLITALPLGLHWVRQRRRPLQPQRNFLSKEGKLTVGRAPQSDLQIRDARVAAQHFSLAPQGDELDRLTLRDEGGGVHLKRRGQRTRQVTVREEVAPGDEILIGRLEEGESYRFRVIVREDRYGVQLLESPDPSPIWAWVGWLLVALVGANTWIYLV